MTDSAEVVVVIEGELAARLTAHQQATGMSPEEVLDLAMEMAEQSEAVAARIRAARRGVDLDG